MADYESNWQNAMGGHLDLNIQPSKPAGPSEDPDDPSYVAPKGYKPSSVTQRKNWNQFLDYLDKKGLGGSKDLDQRDKSLGLKHLREYNKANPDAAVPEGFIPTAQYESYLIRKKNQFPGLSPDQAKYAFSNLPAAYRNKPLSPQDNWLGSYTSKEYYPTFERASKSGKEQFGTDFEKFVQGIDTSALSTPQSK
jgi:hypothetical protein